MKILINPKIFLKEFIDPILNVVKNEKSAIFSDGTTIHTVWADQGVRKAFFHSFTPKAILDNVPRFNVDLQKVAKALECLSKDVEETVLDIDTTKKKVILCQDGWNINIGMVEDIFVKVPSINFDIIQKDELLLDQVEVSNSIIKDLKKAMMFATESLKMYLSKINNTLTITLGDKTQPHLDTISLALKSNFDKTFNECIYDAEFLQNIFRIKSDFVMKLLTNKALVIRTKTEFSETVHVATHIKK